MKKIIITEQIYSSVKIVADLKQLFPLFLEAAQKVYDSWNQDEEGYDEMYGSGGICDDIASEICTIVSRKTNYGCFTYYNEYNYHTVCYVYVCNDIENQEDYGRGHMFTVDIPYNNYEEGSGYTFKKIPNVKFTADMIEIKDMSGFFDEYISNNCEPFDN